MIGQAFLAAVASLLWAVSPLPDKPTAYATDRAGVFDPARLSALNEKLAGFERTTSNQVLVYVDRRVPAGTTLEEMAAAAVRAWGVGQKDRSNGVIFFAFVDDKTMRLEVGYGLEGAIPDARAKQITSEVIKPFFKQGDYPGGVEAGVDAVFSAARGEAYVGPGRTVAERRRVDSGVLPDWAGPLFPLGLSLGALVSRFRKRRRGRSLVVGLAWTSAALGVGSLLAAVACAQPLWLFLAFPTLVIGVVLAIVAWAMVVAYRARGAAAGGRRWASTSSDVSYSSSSSSDYSGSSSSSSDSSSSDFSGGGGDSGGGGSSDSW